MQTQSTPMINAGAAAIIGFLLAVAVLVLGAHSDFSLADEGYLWYGAQRVLAGEVPLRDFQGYDPFRYYWAAGVMGLLRDHGIVALRIAVMLFGALGVALANWLMFRRAQRMLLLNLLIAGIFVLWLLPRHKLFDITTCIGLVAVLTLFLENPSRRRSFLMGVAVGFVAIIGRNHGLYGATASLLVLAYAVWAERKGDAAGLFGCWGAGLVVGYLPMLLALLLVPGMFQAVLDGILPYFRLGATNVELPLPLPWRVPFLHQSMVESLRQFLVGLLCLGLPLFGLLGLGFASSRARAQRAAFPPLVVACTALAIPYTHDFYSRADLAHLAQSIFPLLIAVCALVVMGSGKKPAVFAALLLAVSAFLMLPLQPLYAAWSSGHWQSQKIGTDVLSMPAATAADVSRLQALVARYAPDGRPFLAVPYMPGAYALFERRAPVWEIYPLFRADDAHQEREISALTEAHIGFALVDTRALDRNPELRFSEHDPLVYKFLSTQLQKIDDPTLPKDWELYAATPAAGTDKTPISK